MNVQTLAFLEELWNSDILKGDVLTLCKEAFLDDISKELKGVSQSDTIWVSESAKRIRNRIAEIQNSIEDCQYPGQLYDLLTEYSKLLGEIRAMQIKTARALSSYSSLSFRDVHVIVKPLFHKAVVELQKQTDYQLLRLLLLAGSIPSTVRNKTSNNNLQQWVYYYQEELSPVLDALEPTLIDGRWAYEKHEIIIKNNLVIHQFVSVQPRDNEIKSLIGRPSIDVGANGELRFYGRGHISNIKPSHMKNLNRLKYYTKLESVFDDVISEDSLPIQNLDKLFRGDLYLISPNDYFSFINQYIIAKSFHERIKMGHCLLCGRPLVNGNCMHCRGSL